MAKSSEWNIGLRGLKLFWVQICKVAFDLTYTADSSIWFAHNFAISARACLKVSIKRVQAFSKLLGYFVKAGSRRSSSLDGQTERARVERRKFISRISLATLNHKSKQTLWGGREQLVYNLVSIGEE